MKKRKIATIVGVTTLIASLALGGSVMAAETGTQKTFEMPKMFKIFGGPGANLEGVAEKLGIDIKGMTNEEIAQAIRDNELGKLKTALSEKGIATENLTEQEIMAKARENGLMGGTMHMKIKQSGELAKELGIDTTGMTEEQIMQKLEENGLMPKFKEVRGMMRGDMMHDGMMGGRLSKAIEFDITGLTDEQILQKIKESGITDGGGKIRIQKFEEPTQETNTTNATN